MANNEMKTNAEIYREQRKERLAKAAKKKAHSKRDKIIGTIVKVVCILVALGFVLTFTANTLIKVYNVPQKFISAATYGDQKLTFAEYNYYYMSLYNDACTLSQQNDAQYAGYGTSLFDIKKSPAEQDYKGEDAPEGVKTWADYFEHMAVERGFLMKTLYNDSLNNKDFKLTDEQQKELDESIKELKKNIEEYAEQNDVSTNVYVAKTCGEGLNFEKYIELVERDQIASHYLTWYQENTAEGISDEDIEKYYKTNKDTLDIVSLRFFAIPYKAENAEESAEESTAKYTKAEAKKRADAFLSEITDESSFADLALKYAEEENKDAYKDSSATFQSGITKAGLKNLSEDFANWTFDAKRQNGDSAVFDIESNSLYYVIYVVSSAAKDTSVASANVRHLLVQATTTDENGKDLSEAQKNKNFEEAKKEADALLSEWKAGEATEKSFIKLVKEHTDDAGSKETGGLYEGVANDGKYVQQFTDWALEDHKPGDTGIVKTTYGYHIMYYVSNDGTEKWEDDTRTAIATEKYNEYFNGLYDDISEKAERANEKVTDFFAGRNLEKIEDIIDRNYGSSVQL